MAAGKILLLEDDLNLNETVCEYLEEHDYEVVSAYDGYEAQEKIYEQHFDLLLLDINTPGIDGFALLNTAREEGVQTPAIYITSRESVADLEQGFKSGCDDYIRKPFALKELLIRVETLLKREFFHKKKSCIPIADKIDYDPVNSCLLIDEKPHQLSAKEARLLKLFIQHPGEIVSHKRIFSVLWNYDEEPSDSSLRTYIKNLRSLIGRERIVSIKKQGYRYIAYK